MAGLPTRRVSRLSGFRLPAGHGKVHITLWDSSSTSRARGSGDPRRTLNVTFPIGWSDLAHHPRARHAKDEVCANHQEASIENLVDRFIRYIQGLSPEETRRKAGILSEDFWLREECQK